MTPAMHHSRCALLRLLEIFDSLDRFHPDRADKTTPLSDSHPWVQVPRQTRPAQLILARACRGSLRHRSFVSFEPRNRLNTPNPLALDQTFVASAGTPHWERASPMLHGVAPH